MTAPWIGEMTPEERAKAINDACWKLVPDDWEEPIAAAIRDAEQRATAKMCHEIRALPKSDRIEIRMEVGMIYKVYKKAKEAAKAINAEKSGLPAHVIAVGDCLWRVVRTDHPEMLPYVVIYYAGEE